ncbi:inositol hexakisphosphate and diphosphoinositol-pentakisphosphate kinase isoform X3 [Ceratina calcarata]|uniref:Inositol hexakisphosphate and diphosphoinositol-pentakisphosphate kinase n=1 Tax=Ceratina calcarata TaxID=156304 RepID=A0AAJ7S8I5_9HYME|nr:inositol hexakisphosphate and diphosphoinositol-pentakisphosphate kinase isoform X3 [Ceratina calcarata]
MSYTELEHGYQGLRNASRPIFYVGDLNTVQPNLVGPVASSIYRSSKRAELSDGCSNDDGCMGGSDLEGEGKQVLVGVCAMAKKSQSKPMKEILTRLEEFEYIKIVVFPEEVILKESVEDWPVVDCLISFHSKGFPLDKAISYANLRNPFIINNLPMQYDIQDRRRVYAILESEGIEIPRYAVLDRDSSDPKHHELVESEDHVEVNGVTFNKPFVEKPVSAEDHNIYIYYPTSAGGGSQRLFRKIGSRSSVYSPESRVRKTGSYIYEDFMPTDGTDVKVYTVGPDYAHAEARKSPALDGKVERDSEGKEIRYPVILSNAEKLISRKVCLAFKQTVCGFDLLRANGQSFVCDVNGFSFVKNSNKYYDDCAKILGNMILRELAPTLHIPWSVPFQLDDPPIVPTTFGKMMELRCVVAVIRHGDRTPKQKMKVEVRHPKFFEIFAKYDGYKHGHIKLKRPKQLQEILDTARSLLAEIQHRAAGPELEEKQGKLEQLKSVLEMYGHFSGINRKVQMKYQPRGRPRGSSSDDDRLGEPSLVLILKWGGELTPAGRIQAEELGRIFRCMYPGGQGRHLSEEDSEMLPNHGDYAGAQGLGLLRLHSTFRHDLKIYASDEGRVQMTAAAFAKGLLALEGELTPILVQMVKSANTNGLLDNDCDSSKYQNMVKTRLHELLQQDRDFTPEDREQINPGNALSINAALDFVKNPVRCCQHVHTLIQKLMDIVRTKKDDPKTKDAILYHGETWELMGRRWGKIEKDFCQKNKRFDISKIPDIYDCIKYDLQHNNHTLQFEHAEELYIYSKYLADIVIPQEYGLTVQEKLTIGQGICTPLLKKIKADLQRNIEESEETVNRLNPRYSHGVSSPGRHVRTRLYFTSESHVHSLLTVLRYGGLLDVIKDEQWRRAMEYVSMVSELNYMSQIVVMLYEDPTKDPSSEERFHVELHFSPGVNCCVQKNLPPGPGFRPHSRNESSHNVGESGGSAQDTISQCSTRIEEEDVELGILEDDFMTPLKADTSPPPVETDVADGTMDSPMNSRAVDMMDLDPNMMDEPFDSGFLQSSAPIPISARTVAGHEAARLGSQLAASQRQRRDTERGNSVEPRARSYDHQRQDKSEKAADKLQYQSLDAVNKEEKHGTEQCYVERSGLSSLSVPITGLSHSYSSPEFPVPTVDTPTYSTPLVTLHTSPLVSPSNRATFGFDATSLTFPVPTIRSSFLDTDLVPIVADPPSQSKKYGRSHSELTLPGIEHSGELTDSARPPPSDPNWPKHSLSSLSLHESIPVPAAVRPLFLDDLDTQGSKRYTRSRSETVLRGIDDPTALTKRYPFSLPLSLRFNPEKRSRSLSPYLAKCLCYNCNVSELILRSRELPPVERSNFDVYFARSLSHKFFNCSCYSSPRFESPRRFVIPSSLACVGNRLPEEQSDLVHYPDSNSRSVSFDRSELSVDKGNFMRRSFSGGNVIEGIAKCSLDKKTSCPCLRSYSWLDSVSSNASSNGISRMCRRWSCPNVNLLRWDGSLVDAPDRSVTLIHTHDNNDDHVNITTAATPDNYHHHRNKYNNHRSKCPCAPFSRLQPQRSFSSPDTRPSIIQPDPTCTARRHRHSISGQMSYFKLLGYNINKKLTGSANSLFSTAVISGSSSAPNLKDMVPPHASAVAAIEGFGGVPPIRPLETLHNALSLRQLDAFLDIMTSVPLFRTPASSPPKYPSPGGSTHESVNQNLNIRGIGPEYNASDLEAVRYREKLSKPCLYISPTPIQYKPPIDGESCDIRNQLSPTSPNSTGWSSEPQSFLSSEPSSPAPTSTGECSMSISLISNDGAQLFNTPKFPTTPCLDVDFNEFCINMDQEHREGRGSVSYTDYYSNEDGQIRKFDMGFNSNLQKIMCTDDLPADNMDDDEDHTITLKQTEEQKKQDVKEIFEQKENPCSKSSGSYKKIGRFLVESMDISDEDVRIKELDSANKAKSNPQRTETPNTEKFLRNREQGKKKNFSRSQSVSMPKTPMQKADMNYSYRCTTKLSSLSNMSDKDLEDWKQSMVESTDVTSKETTSEQPILTVASSMTSSSSVTIGFNVQEESKEESDP